MVFNEMDKNIFNAISVWRLTACLLVVQLTGLALLRAQTRGPLVEREQRLRACELDDDRLSGAVVLQAGCFYTQSFEIDEPDTTLDCNGAELRPEDGFAVNIKRNADRAIVRNCYVRGVKGIAVRVRKVRDGESDDDVRALAPQDVVIENVDIVSTESVGVHLLPHTVGVTVRDSVLSNNSSSGVYMSPYGRHHRIINNQIENNGHIKADGTPRIGWYRREGIAIDGSSEHHIAGNDISANAFGGILLYKNCWEHAAEEPNSRPRTDHARANLIENNHFRDQPFGVWIAARQSRDLTLMGCGDPTPYRNPIAVMDVFHPTYGDYASAAIELYLLSLNFASVWPDFAEDNEIIGNTFESIGRGGIRIEDDGTRVADNLFIGDFDYVFIGAPFRARLAGQPVDNTAITNNSYHSPNGVNFSERLALIPDEHTNTVLRDNVRACVDARGQYVRHGVEREVERMTRCAVSERCTDGRWVQVEDTDCNPHSDADGGVAADDMMTRMMDMLPGGETFVDASVENPSQRDADTVLSDVGATTRADGSSQSSSVGSPAAARSAGCSNYMSGASTNPMAYLLFLTVIWIRRRLSRSQLIQSRP